MRSVNRLYSLIVLSVLSGSACFSQLPETEIWLFSIRKDKQGHQSLEKPVNITKRKGYDNQPCFYPEKNRIYYSSERGGQTDLYYYDLKKKKNVLLAGTPESEYSPALVPGQEKLMAVVVESDSAQRLHKIDVLTGLHEKSLETDSIGYFTFLNADTIIYYKLTRPHSLWCMSVSSGEHTWLGNNPARGFLGLDRHTLLYALKDSTSMNYYTYDFLLRKAVLYTSVKTPAEDLTWHETLGLVRPQGSQILAFNVREKEWEMLYDLAVFGINKVSRLYFSRDGKHLVIVDNLQ